MSNDETIGKVATLTNDMPLISRHIPGCPLEVCGIAVDAGSRDETPDRHGLAHFVEHTLFKGTRHRRSWAINSRMETVGGELNAYTSKEETLIYTIAPKGWLSRAVDLLADLVCNPVFPDAEVDKERDVVLEELSASLDNPSDCIFDEFEQLAYSNTSAAHNILGTPESLKNLSAYDCRQWVEEMYTPGRLLFFHAGDSKIDSVHRLADKYLGSLSRADNDRPLRNHIACENIFHKSVNHNNHQANCVQGIRVPGLDTPGRVALALLTNILGGPGANSLLNLRLREKGGLVYSVDATTSLLTNMGLLNIYFGCDPDDATRCRRLVESIINRLRNNTMSDRALSMAKRQFLGQTTVASVNPVEDILGEARLRLHGFTPLTHTQLENRLKEITPLHLKNMAAKWGPLSSLTIL